ncbi:amidohydrolase family protein [Nocardia donostiensis]|uniref:Amidohydrolase n=1 Tax=Nocardia donostiensis TaxID=1538463 RepID=A0A1W0BH15_9NOCA|nr:amidohydrolase family protein [Nocardia donostiensis]ONM49270.1 amidohydrolase [Nocardia donostiensis]OQS21794.1 amidohydrolase [Nocardia donostiensis]
MRTIALEEHFTTPAFLSGPGRAMAEQARAAGGGPILDLLGELGDERIAAMDRAGIDVQVLSLTAPGVEQSDPREAASLARETNDHLAEAVRRHPARFAAFATLPTAVPERAADELERVVREHGFVGALINGHTRGRYLDDEFFWPILERAEALRVPIYLHPTPPPRPVVEASYLGNYPPEVAETFATSGWGWHIETATHVLRIVLSGAFDRFPELQLVIGHMGEGLSFMMPRFEQIMSHVVKLERPVGEYFTTNLHYTFAAFNWTPTFLNLLLQVGADRILFATDHPYGSMDIARSFLDQLPVGRPDREQIAYRNAERLLRLPS